MTSVTPVSQDRVASYIITVTGAQTRPARFPFSSGHQMLATIRSRAVLALALFSLAACGEDGPTFETTLDPTETALDVEAVQAAFETEATVSLEALGSNIDAAIAAAGGVAISMPSIVAAGPNPSRMPAMMEGIRPYTATSEPMAALPASIVGKVMVWDVATSQYVISQQNGAPTGGVRFILYQVDEFSYLPVEPLVAIGTLDLVQGGSESSPTASLVVKNAGGTTVLQYLASVTQTSIRVEGTAGTGANTATFSLVSAYDIFDEEFTITWNVGVPGRGITQRVTFGFDFSNQETVAFSFNGVLRRGLSKIEIGGTIDFYTGGQLTVEVGDRLYARINFDPEGGTVVTNAQGQPLTAEEEETLQRVFEIFFGALDATTGLLNPVSTILGAETPLP